MNSNWVVLLNEPKLDLFVRVIGFKLLLHYLLLYWVAMKWSQFCVRDLASKSRTVSLSCRAWSREGSQGLALVKSQLRAGCVWLCQSQLPPRTRQGQTLATAVRRVECVAPPPLLSPEPFLRLRHCSKPLQQHYPEPSPDQAQPVTATSSHWQHQSHLILVTRHQVMFWLSHIVFIGNIHLFGEITLRTLYCLRVEGLDKFWW